MVFDALNLGSSHIINPNISKDSSYLMHQTGENKISVRTVALDDIVGDRTVGFIKMDIEGAEFDALYGAENTIVRDKPFLAICVYHLRGDLFAIMDYFGLYKSMYFVRNGGGDFLTIDFICCTIEKSMYSHGKKWH